MFNVQQIDRGFARNVEELDKIQANFKRAEEALIRCQDLQRENGNVDDNLCALKKRHAEAKFQYLTSYRNVLLNLKKELQLARTGYRRKFIQSRIDKVLSSMKNEVIDEQSSQNDDDLSSKGEGSRLLPPQKLHKSQLNRLVERLQGDIEERKARRIMADAIKEKGNFQNFLRAEELKKIPKTISKIKIKQRKNSQSKHMETMKTLGTARLKAATIIQEAPQNLFQGNEEFQAREIGQLNVKHATILQKSQLHDRSAMLDHDESVENRRNMLAMLEAEVDHSLPTQVLAQSEHDRIETIWEYTNSSLNQIYYDFVTTDDLGDKTRNKRKTLMLRKIEKSLTRMFELMRISMAAHRGGTFRATTVENDQFIDQIREYFTAEPDPERVLQYLDEQFRTIKLPPFKSRSTQSNASTRDYVAPSVYQVRQELDAMVKESAAKAVAKEVNRLKVIKRKVESSKPEMNRALNKFTNDFCQIFTVSHNKTRNEGYEVWAKAFLDEMNRMLDDLEAFFRTWPHFDVHKYDRNYIQQQFYRFLEVLYEETKRINVEGGRDIPICVEIIGRKLQVSAEAERLKVLQKSLLTFLEQIHNLMEPHLEVIRDKNAASSKDDRVLMQTPRQATKIAEQVRDRSNQRLDQSTHERSATPNRGRVQTPQRERIRTPVHRQMQISSQPDRSFSRPPSAQQAPNKSMRILSSNRENLSRIGQMQSHKVNDSHQQSSGSKIKQIKQLHDESANEQQSRQLTRVELLRERTLNGTVQRLPENIHPETELSNQQIQRNNDMFEAIDDHQFFEFQERVVKIYDLWDQFQENFCKIIVNPNEMRINDFIDSIYQPLRDLKDEFFEVLYGRNEELFMREIQDLDKDFCSFQINAFSHFLLSRHDINVNDCEEVKDRHPRDDDTEVNAEIARFFRKVKTFIEKYANKIMNGQAYGHRNLMPKRKSSENPEALGNPTSRCCQPQKVLSSKRKTLIRPSPRKAGVCSKNISQTCFKRSRKGQKSGGIKTIQPFSYFEGCSIPKHVIETDILFVTHRLIHLQEKDLPFESNSLTRDMMRHAILFHHLGNVKVTLAAIEARLNRSKYIPMDFFKVAVYHPGNKYFDGVEFENPKMSHAVRVFMHFMKKLNVCSNDHKQLALTSSESPNHVRSLHPTQFSKTSQATPQATIVSCSSSGCS